MIEVRRAVDPESSLLDPDPKGNILKKKLKNTRKLVIIVSKFGSATVHGVILLTIYVFCLFSGVKNFHKII